VCVCVCVCVCVFGPWQNFECSTNLVQENLLRNEKLGFNIYNFEWIKIVSAFGSRLHDAWQIWIHQLYVELVLQVFVHTRPLFSPKCGNLVRASERYAFVLHVSATILVVRVHGQRFQVGLYEFSNKWICEIRCQFCRGAPNKM
jgi:hypothetical protein